MISPTSYANAFFFGFDGSVGVALREAGAWLYPETITEELLDPELLARIIAAGDDVAALAAIVGGVTTWRATTVDPHIANTANPHQVTKAQVGLGNVDNTADVDKPMSDAVSDGIDGMATSLTTYVNDTLGTHTTATAAHGATGAVVGTTNAQTLTGKRVVPRVTGAATATTITVNADLFDQYGLTALASSCTINAPTGTPSSGQMVVISIADNGTSRALTWNGIFVSFDRPLPATTAEVGGSFYAFFRYNATTAKWVLVQLSAASGLNLGTAWGAISGTLSSQGDLNAALGGKANTAHTHGGADITSGSVAMARLPTGTTSGTLATGERGLPAGGATGATLKKQSGTDYDVTWGAVRAPVLNAATSTSTTAQNSGAVDYVSCVLSLPNDGNYLIVVFGSYSAEGSVAAADLQLKPTIGGSVNGYPTYRVEQGVDQALSAMHMVAVAGNQTLTCKLTIQWVAGTISPKGGAIQAVAIPV